MIDVWLLFGLILPFLGFILSIFEELVAQAQEDADTGRVKVELQNNLLYFKVWNTSRWMEP